MLTDEQLMRYNRQILLNDFDIAGQERLQQSRVLVVATRPHIQYLPHLEKI